MDLANLQSQIEDYFRARASDFGRNIVGVQAEFVLNWGGFGNQSFSVTDGSRKLHLKISDDADNQTAMRRWNALHSPLEQHYHAPPLLDWITLPGTEFAGLLFEHIVGTMPTELSPELAQSILPVIQRLHGDTELAQRLDPPRTPLTCRAIYQDTYHDRLTEDLAIIAPPRPPFVPEATLKWLNAEVAAMERLVSHTKVFDLPAISPIHGDLWVNNLLVTETGDWTILD